MLSGRWTQEQRIIGSTDSVPLCDLHEVISDTRGKRTVCPLTLALARSSSSGSSSSVFSLF